MDKSQYIDKCMALLNDTKVYKPCKDTTKKLHRDVQESLRRLNREYRTSRLYDWSKLYNKLLLIGNSSPAPRFYGLPKIHKANCPMHHIVSACGMATYQLAKFLTKILQRYMGITPSFVKDSKSFSDHLRSVNISEEEELVSLWHFCPLHQHPSPHILGCNQPPILWTHWRSWGQTQIWLLFQMEHHWPWKRWGNATPKISLGELCLHLPGQVL